MDNFETELVVKGARIALTTYAIQPLNLKTLMSPQRYGKYILASS